MEQLLAQLHRSHEAEEYPEPIKRQADKVEILFERYSQKKLDVVNDKVLRIARAAFDMQSGRLAKAYSTPQDFGQQDFDFDENLLTPMLDISVNYQYDYVKDKLQSEGTDPSKVSQLYGINFDIGNGVKYIDLLRGRKAYLAKVLEENTLKKVNQIIEDGIRKGESFDQIAARLQKGLEMDRTRARKIARTETNWALNEGARQYMSDIGVQQYQISLAADACPECRRIAGATEGETLGSKKFSIEEGNIVPIHPFCRCVIVSVIPEEWLRPNDSPLIQIFENFIPRDQSIQVRQLLSEVAPPKQSLADLLAAKRAQVPGKTEIVGQKVMGSQYQANKELEFITSHLTGQDQLTELQKFVSKYQEILPTIADKEVQGIIRSSIKNAKGLLEFAGQKAAATTTTTATGFLNKPLTGEIAQAAQRVSTVTPTTGFLGKPINPIPEQIFYRGAGNNIGISAGARGLYTTTSLSDAKRYGSLITGFRPKVNAKIIDSQDIPSQILADALIAAGPNTNLQAWSNRRGQYIADWLKENGWDAVVYRKDPIQDLVIINKTMFEEVPI